MTFGYDVRGILLKSDSEIISQTLVTGIDNTISFSSEVYQIWVKNDSDQDHAYINFDQAADYNDWHLRPLDEIWFQRITITDVHAISPGTPRIQAIGWRL